MTSLPSHQTHLFAIFQQISALSVISLSGCHIIGSITVATARNAASLSGALNFISSPEGCAGWGGGGAGLYQSLSAHPDTTDCGTIRPSAACIHRRPGAHLLHLTHQSDWLRKYTFVVFSVCCYDASYLLRSNYATALKLYSLTKTSSQRTVHFQRGLTGTSQIHPSIPMSNKQSAF